MGGRPSELSALSEALREAADERRANYPARMRQQVYQFRCTVADQIQVAIEDTDIPEVDGDMTLTKYIEWLRNGEVR